MAHPITYVAGMSSSLDELRRCLEILELTPGAAWADVRSRYRFLAKVFHPDRFAHDDAARIEAELRFKGINEQAFGPGSYYDCLRDRLRGRAQAR